MKEILFLKPVFKEMIWGGNKLSAEFGYDIPSNQTGECWAISAHPNGDCEVLEGSYKGKKLSWLWKEEKELFGDSEKSQFPLLVKIIDAKEDLSIQVHPDDNYAREHENGSLGKTECWYILNCEKDATIVVGHNAKDKEELKQMIEQKRWTELIKVRPIKKGDFFQITPGTVHAIKGGTVILETQQSSDITYRLYDYDRLQNGKPRELHLDKSIDVIKNPYQEVTSQKEKKVVEGATIEQLISCEYYTVDKITVSGTFTMPQEGNFTLCSVIEGQGSIDGHAVQKGSHFILPAHYGDSCLSGTMELICSHP